MQKVLILISSFLLLTTFLSAQKVKPITVLAGLKVEDCIPFQERYRYPEFTTGTVFFKQGSEMEAKFNYNFMKREMEFMQGKDTLAIANESDIQQIIVSGTVFLVNKGYLELISNGKLTFGIKQYFNLMNVRKKDFYGDMGSSSATQSYSSLHSNSHYYKLTVNQDRIFQKVAEYYLVTPSGNFVHFTRKKAMQLFPKNKNAIRNYLKSNKTDFDSREDLLRFAEYVSTLK